jgi:hypothetical protein
MFNRELEMLQTQCLCGEIRIETTRAPDFIHACNCNLCTATGAHWAYFAPQEVKVTGSGSTYSRSDKPDPAAAVHFCTVCGTTTHFTLTESAIAQFGNTMMGVNVRLTDENTLAGIERRFPDGRAWQGSGDFSYVRAAEIIGKQP